LESRPFQNRIPDTTIIVKGQGIKADYITAFRDNAGRYMMIYIPVGKAFTINTSFIPSRKIRVAWFNPKTGKISFTKSIYNTKLNYFTTPTRGQGNDWVLILDAINDDFQKAVNGMQ